MADLIPPSAAVLPPSAELRERLAIALREVHLLRRLIRAAESVRPHSAAEEKKQGGRSNG